MTEQDFLNIIGNKISNEMQKAIIRNNYAPQLAEPLCNAIDSHEKVDLFQKLMNEWIAYQNRQQQIIQAFFQQYNK
jgi:hypothetical protein